MWSSAILELIFSSRDLLVSTALVLLATALFKKARSSLRLPPGPTGLPYVGVLFNIKKTFHLQTLDWAKRFGGVCSFRMGTKTVVVLSDYEAIEKGFSSFDIVGRPSLDVCTFLEGYGIVNSEKMLWYNQRRYLQRISFGAKNTVGGKGGAARSVENCIRREAVEFLQNILEHTDSGRVDPEMLLNSAASNLICGMVMSRRFRHDDPMFKGFMDKFDEGFRLFNEAGAVAFLPVFRFFPQVTRALSKIQQNHAEMMAFVRTIIDEHKADLDPENPRDLVDNYLIDIMESREKGEDLFNGMDPEHQLAQVVLDLFSAGVETVKTTLQWAILHLLHNTEVAAKVQRELDEVVGDSRLPEWSDRPNLPYTHAVVNEVMRISSVVPLGTTHSTERDIELNGYQIPAGAHVIPHIHRVHHDPEHFPDPERLVPERFLDETGTKVMRVRHFIPYGTGKRSCLGKWLAEKELFVVFASLMHVFELRKPSAAADAVPAVTESDAGVTVTPKKFRVDFRPRHLDAFIAAKQKMQAEHPEYVPAAAAAGADPADSNGSRRG